MPDTSASTGWFPVLTLILGYLFGAVSEWLRDRRISERDKANAEATLIREREAREETRRLQLFESRINFQRETLLALQEAIVRLTRVTGEMKLLDDMAYRNTGKWGSELFPDQLSNDALQFSVKAMVLASRVRDKEIREMAQEFRGYANSVTLAKNERDSFATISKMTDVLEPLHKRIGETLSKLDDDEDARFRPTSDA